MVRNSSERLTVIERLSCARISAGIRYVYSRLVDLYRQAQVNKKDRPSKTLASYGIGLFD
jgi:hypothetical protein